MRLLLYDDLVSWYRLVDPIADHFDEAASYSEALARGAVPPAATLLELGAGAGNNAFHMKRRFRCTLTDVSEAMQTLSAAINPDCEHLLGDMRTLRVGRQFDAVFVHDAVVYMTTEADLSAVAATAFVHTRPGGSALFAPDCVRETFRDATLLIANDDGGRSLRGLEWSWDPDPGDTLYSVEYAFLLREGGFVRSVHDRHVEGLFPRATWVGVLKEAGFEVETTPRPLDDGAHDEVFLCRRP